ncbi:MAG TPA: amidohydrolase family protein [Actinomycetota bacterium]|nr:amidohydrolase family protein [Actinomycetota bacterium]
MTTLAVRSPLAWLGPGRLLEDALIILEGGRIAFAGAAAELGVAVAGERGRETLSGQPAPPEPDQEIHVDGFVMPGVVDRHVHIGLSDPGAVVAGGVTAVRDLGWPPEAVFPLADASESPSFNGPLIRAVGPMITCRGGYPTRSGWAPAGTGREVSGADEAARVTRETLDRSGVAVVKVALNADAGPTLADEELLAVCDTAHQANAIVTAHCQGTAQVQRALGAGVDELAHCPWTERLSEDTIEALARRTRIVSTLDIHSYGRDTPELRIATENLGRFIQAGGRAVYGTDLGNGPIPSGIHPGEAWHLHRAGLSADQVLEALTFRPLAPGEPADLVALEANPLEDLAALDQPRLVIRAGRRVR